MKRMMTTEKRCTRILTVAVATMALAGIMPGVVHAQDIIAPTANSTSTTYQDAARSILAALDGSNLSGGGTSSNILEETTSRVGADDHWLTSASIPVADEVVTFDLGGTYNVNAIHIWPYIRDQTNRNVRTCDVSFSTDDGATYPTTISAATLGDILTGPFASGGTQPVQTTTFTEQSDVTHIRFTNIQNFGDARVAISEIRFGGTLAAPPPPSAVGAIGIETLVLNVNDTVATSLQWQKSADGGTWSDVSGETATTLDVTGLYADTPWFRVEATNFTNPSDFSTTLRVNTSGAGGTVVFFK